MAQRKENDMSGVRYKHKSDTKKQSTETEKKWLMKMYGKVDLSRRLNRIIISSMLVTVKERKRKDKRKKIKACANRNIFTALKRGRENERERDVRERIKRIQQKCIACWRRRMEERKLT